MFFLKRNERKVGFEKSWPYLVLFLRSSSCSLGQKVIPTDPSMSHRSGDTPPVPAYYGHALPLKEYSLDLGVFPLCICLGSQQFIGPLN